MTRLRLLLAAFAVLAAAAPASASAATALYPDMRTLPPRDMRFDVADTDSGRQNVLRFTNTAWNAGQGPLEVGGTVPSGATTVPATQTVKNDDGTKSSYNVGNYTIHVQHQHFHYDDWGRYELWTKAEYDRWLADGRPAARQPDIIGTKTTSCILDEEFIASIPGTPYPRVYPDSGCDASSGKIASGLSVGWGDTYDYYRYDQWIPLGTTKLADGEYVLRSIADPFNKIHESPGKADPARESQLANEATTNMKIVGGVIQDLDRPTGTVTINDVNATTGSTNVTVRVLGRDDVSGVSQVRVSNDGVTWRQYAYGGSGSAPMSIAWDLADTRYGGSTAGGVRTVYAQFQDHTGKWSASETDTIDFTTGTPPPGGGGGSNSLYRTAIMGDGPVSYWRLGETSGTAAADQTGTNPATHLGTTVGAASLLNSDVDRSAYFNGTAVAKTNPNTSLNLGSSLSLEAWIKPESIPAAGGWASIVTKPEAYTLQFNGPRLEFTIIQNGVRKRLQAPIGAVVAGQTYHVLGTYDGAEQRLYLNGNLVASIALTGPASAGWGGVHIGSWAGSSEFFRGTIDEVAVYNKMLTGLQAKQHYDAGVSTAVGVATPTSLAATATSPTSVNVTWLDNSNNETGFVLERSTTSTFTSPTAINVAQNATSYSDTGRTAGTTYWYRVRAVTATDQSAWSNAASATTPTSTPTAPAAPSGLSAAAVSDSRIDLGWTDNATDETGYVVERSTTSTFSSPTAINLPAGATSYSDTGRAASTTYWYRVRAVNGTAVSAWSATASATTQAPAPTAPAAPSGLTATATSQTAISLAWTDNASNETGYVLERSATSAFTTVQSIPLAANATSHSDTGLTAATTYWYRVRAINGSLVSAWSGSASATTQSTTQPPATTYAGAVTADAPVSHWRLGETTGTAAADARGANPGTYRNGALLGQPSLLSTDAANRAARFDGGNDDVLIADNASLDFTTALTVEAWIKPETIPAAGGWASVVTKPEAYSLQFNGPLLEFTLIQSGTRRRLQAPAGSVVAGRTYHVVATYDGVNQRMYLNGALVSSRAQTGPATATTWPLTIASWNGGELFRGTVDEVAVYNKPLAADRVSAHYQAGGPVATATAAARTSSPRVERNRRAKPALLGPAQRRTYARTGPGAKRSRPLPPRRAG